MNAKTQGRTNEDEHPKEILQGGTRPAAAAPPHNHWVYPGPHTPGTSDQRRECGHCAHSEAHKSLNRENTRPRLDSDCIPSPANTGNPGKHAESGPIRQQYDPIRRPKRERCTRANWPVSSIAPPTPGRARVCCILRREPTGTEYGQPQHHAPSAAADGISIVSLRLWTSLTRDSPTWSQYKASHSPWRSPWQNRDSNSGSGPAADEVEDQDDDGYNQQQVN